MPSHHPHVTIIGLGAFGALLADLLAGHVALSVWDRCPLARRAAAARGHRVLPGPGTLPGDIVVFAVPVQALAACLRDLAPALRPGQVVVDVCSVKEEPVRIMRELVPAGVDILATHPMFGPQSLTGGRAGLQVVLCPVRGRGWRAIARFLRRRMGFDVVVTTAEDHDRQAAMTQGLTHLLAHAFAALGAPPRIRTRSYELLEQAFAMVRGDAPEVFAAVTRANPHVAGVNARLVRALDALAGDQSSRSR